MAAAGNAGGGAVYVDDVFSTHSHLGDGTDAHRIVNGIDLSSRGGAVWFFNRDDNNANKTFITTDLGGVNFLKTETQNALQSSGSTSGIQALHDDGFTVGEYGIENVNNEVTLSWTFAKQEKFFDVVTYTGTGNARTIAHNLNSVPGMIWVKKTSGSSSDWIVYHSGSIQEPSDHTTTIDAKHEYLQLNSIAASATSTGAFNSTTPTSTVFSVGVNASVNNNNEQYVAYLFAHNNNDGIFGEDEDQDIIKCGNFKDDGGDKAYSIGFEPQWLLIKSQTANGQWQIIDTQRGWAGKLDAIGNNAIATKVAQNPLLAELNTNDKFYLTSDGFGVVGSGSNVNFVFVAIRRSNKPASEFTSSQLFSMAAGSSSHNGFRNGIITDFAFAGQRSGTDKWYLSARPLRFGYLNTANTAVRQSSNFGFDQKDTTGFFEVTGSFNNYFGWGWRRTTGFCDQIIYEGNGSGNRAIYHSLGAIPEMIWIKCLDSAAPGGSTANWVVGVKALSDVAAAAGTTQDIFLYLNSQIATPTAGSQNFFGSYTFREGNYTLDYATNSSESLVLGNGDAVNRNGFHYMAMLFASVPGISKIGTYTGSSSAQTIDCGFSNGAKFVLTKSHNDGGEWNIWDTTRGIVAGDDKRLMLNRTDAEGEVDYIDPHSSGFSLPNNSATNSNAQGQKYIFYAIAT